MSGNGNGSMEGGVVTTATPEQVAQIEAQLNAIKPAVRQVMGTVIRGIMVSTNVPPHVLLNCIAWETGNLLAGALNGDVMALIQVRKGINEAFAQGVRTAKMNAGPAPAMPAGG